jgi:hypothetical protein
VALIAAFVVVVFAPTPAGAWPSVCNDTNNPDVYRWVGGSGNWDTSANWEHGPGNMSGAPNDDLDGNGTPDQAAAIACISTPGTVVIDSLGTFGRFEVFVQQLHIDAPTRIEVKEGSVLLVNDTNNPSYWAQGSTVAVTAGMLGGLGTIHAQGLITFTSVAPNATFLSSTRVHQSGVVFAGSPGSLVVDSGGEFRVTDLALALYTRYHVEVASGGRAVLDPPGYLVPDDGTSMTIQLGGELEIKGDGGYYQGALVGMETLSALTNNGTIRKSGGTGTSVIDATYTQGPTGQVLVQSGTLALPDDHQVSAQVSPGESVATGTCGGPSSVHCEPTEDPLKDPMSVQFVVPATNGQPAKVLLDEEVGVPLAEDPKAVGNGVLAHADGLVPDGAHPAQIRLRYSQPDVMSTPLNEVQVVHATDDGFQVLLPDCAGGVLPAGLWTCVVRPVTRTSQNTFVTVLTTVTSRWHLRRNLPIENQGAPLAPQGLSVAEAAPFDGSVLRVAWAAPASSGAGPVASYRVELDDKLKSSTTGTSVLIPNPGPGKHTINVTALSAAGHGPRADFSLTIGQLSKPKKVADLRGKSGGALSAGARWKPPAEAGGLAIKGYQVVVVKRGVGKVDKDKVGAAHHKLLFTLKRGEYRFKIRARNGDGYGPWSTWTDWVRPR